MMKSTRQLHGTGGQGDMLGVEQFGASAPAEVLLREYGFTVDNVCARAKALLRRRSVYVILGLAFFYLT